MSLTLAAVLCLLPQGPSANGDAPVERLLTFVPIQDLVAPPPSHTFLHALPVGDLLSVRPRLLLAHTDEQFPTRITPDELSSLIQTISGDEGNLYIGHTATQMQIAGPPESVRRAEAIARALVATLSARVTVQAELHRVAAGAKLPALASNDELGKVLGPQTLLWAGSANGRIGHPVAVRNERRTRYVRDADVEVAQDSKIGDPQVEVLFEGVGLLVEAHALAGSDDFVLFCQFALGERVGPTVTHDIGIRESPILEAPLLQACSGTMSGRVAPGRALVLHGQVADQPGQVLVVRATRAAPRPDRPTELIPVSGLLTGAFAHRLAGPQLELQLEHADADDAAIAEIEAGWLGFASPDELTGALEEALLLSERDCAVTFVGSQLVLTGPQAPRDEVLRLVTHWQSRWLRNGEVRCDSDRVDAQGNRTNRHRIGFPMLVGRQVYVASGHQTTAVVDYDVEIAQEAAIANPIVWTLFDGLVVRGALRDGIDDVHANLDITSSAFGPIERRSLEIKDGGSLYLGQELRARYRCDAPVESGQRIELGARGPTPGDARNQGQVDSITLTLH